MNLGGNAPTHEGNCFIKYVYGASEETIRKDLQEKNFKAFSTPTKVEYHVPDGQVSVSICYLPIQYLYCFFFLALATSKAAFILSSLCIDQRRPLTLTKP